MFRTQIWNHLADVKFQANYCHLLSALSGRRSYIYSFVLSFGSSGSVAAWAFWQKYPALWAGIVIVMQVLHIAREHIPFLKQESALNEMAFRFDRLYLECEKLWLKWERRELSLDEATALFYGVREKQIEIAQNGVNARERPSLFSAAQAKTWQDLKRNLGIGGS